jgi:GT2 family glycosyltransferase
VPQVDVVILTWNDGPLLSAALASALGSRDVDVRVFVVDNGSDPPAEIGRDPHVRLVRNATNRGVAPARNQGVRLGTSPLVCLLDSDARLAPRSLRAMADHLLASPDLGLVAPVFVDQPPEASAGRRPTLARKLARGAGLTARYRGVRRDPRATTWDVHFAIGACQLMRRVAFDAVGGLDDAIFYGPEDVDFCLRLRRAGWRVVQAADAPCFHPPRRRNRTLVSRSGIAHGLAVLRHLHRHRKVGA